MSVTMPDRQAEPAGGFLVHPETVRHNQEALLVLSDGSVWKGRSVGSPAGATGDVRLVGGLAAVGETVREVFDRYWRDPGHETFKEYLRVCLPL